MLKGTFFAIVIMFCTGCASLSKGGNMDNHIKAVYSFTHGAIKDGVVQTHLESVISDCLDEECYVSVQSWVLENLTKKQFPEIEGWKDHYVIYNWEEHFLIYK